MHRPGYLDYIGIKRFDAEGNVCGEHRFLGLYTSTAYSASPADIPLLRRKTANVIARAGVAPGSHAGKALRNILANYPRDELFQTSEDDLLRTATGILHLGERQRFRLFVRRDPFERFLVCLIYAPRETYTTELREKWQAILHAAFNGTSSEFNVHLSESVLARVMITVRTEPGKIPHFDVRELEARLALAARRWDDDLKDALIDALGEARGNELLRRFAAALPAAYREDFSARAAVPDIEMMARLSAASPLGMSLYRPLEAEPGMLRFKLFHLGGPVTLSDSQPMLKRMGLKVLDERPYRMAPPDQPPVWLHDFGMQTRPADADVDIDGLHAVFEDAFGRIFPRRGGERRLQPAGGGGADARRRGRRAARLCEIPAPDRLSAVGGVHRIDAGRERLDRARSPRVVEGAVRSRPRGRRRRRSPRRASRTSRPRSTPSTTCRKIACCASSSR